MALSPASRLARRSLRPSRTPAAEWSRTQSEKVLNRVTAHPSTVTPACRPILTTTLSRLPTVAHCCLDLDQTPSRQVQRTCDRV